jgi:hypothetical protein
VENGPVNRVDADGHVGNGQSNSEWVQPYPHPSDLYGELDDPEATVHELLTDSMERAHMGAVLANLRAQGLAGVTKAQNRGAQQPQCEAQMRSRPGDATSVKGVGASHAWWYVTDSSGQDYTLSFTMKVTSSGDVVLNAYAANGPQSSSNPNDNLQHGVVAFDTGRTDSACVGVSKMIQATQNFPNNTVPYGPITGAALSNSGARYLGGVGGFQPKDPSTPFLRAVGWNLRIPGVEN